MKKSSVQYIKEIRLIHAAKGWNSVRAFVRKNKLKVTFNVKQFGLQTNKKSSIEKEKWLSVQKETFRAHYYSIGVKSTSGFSYNILRGQELVILDK